MSMPVLSLFSELPSKVSPYLNSKDLMKWGKTSKENIKIVAKQALPAKLQEEFNTLRDNAKTVESMTKNELCKEGNKDFTFIQENLNNLDKKIIELKASLRIKEKFCGIVISEYFDIQYLTNSIEEQKVLFDSLKKVNSQCR